ncbi:MAG TPA: ABC transporter ATP-binding protein [Pseudolabrys sp.]|nr:ABC transporter ATP-binding protein [Pseudolabrys sp.]
MTAPGLVLENLSLTIGGFHLGPLDVSLAADQVLVILGPNGSGKSVTLETIAGFHRPDTGRVLIRGRDVTALPPERRNIGFVVQNFGLFPHLTVAQNVAAAIRNEREGGTIAGFPQNDIAALLGHFGVARLAARLPQDLSPGEKQRVALARALAAAPDVFLFDEPFSALDIRTRDSLREELQAFLRDLSIPAVFVTHDHTDAMTLADKIVMLHDGAMVQSGAPADVFERPANAFVARFVGVENILDGHLNQTASGAVLIVGDVALQVAGPAPHLKLTDTVKASVRADAVGVHPAGAAPPPMPDVNRLRAKIVEMRSVGPLATLTVDCGFQLRGYRLARDIGALHFGPGSAVIIDVPAASIHLMAD